MEDFVFFSKKGRFSYYNTNKFTIYFISSKSILSLIQIKIILGTIFPNDAYIHQVFFTHVSNQIIL